MLNLKSTDIFPVIPQQATGNTPTIELTFVRECCAYAADRQTDQAQ